MVDFVTWVIFIGVGIAACLWLTIVGLILARLAGYSPNRYTLPPPERTAERMYGQQYFERAMKKD